MTDAAKRPATYADLEAVPDHLVAELLFGNLVTHPRPHRRHGGASSVLGMVLGPPFQLGGGPRTPGGWIFVDEPELRLGPHVMSPDICGWRRERMTEPEDQAYFEIPPDWVCEVLSASTEKYDKGDKRRICALYGVPHLWHLDPRSRTLEVFALQGKNWLLTHTFVDEDEVCAPPFEALTFKLGLLWPFAPPPSTASDQTS